MGPAPYADDQTMGDMERIDVEEGDGHCSWRVLGCVACIVIVGLISAVAVSVAGQFTATPSENATKSSLNESSYTWAPTMYPKHLHKPTQRPKPSIHPSDSRHYTSSPTYKPFVQTLVYIACFKYDCCVKDNIFEFNLNCHYVVRQGSSSIGARCLASNARIM